MENAIPTFRDYIVTNGFGVATVRADERLREDLTLRYEDLVIETEAPSAAFLMIEGSLDMLSSPLEKVRLLAQLPNIVKDFNMRDTIIARRLLFEALDIYHFDERKELFTKMMSLLARRYMEFQRNLALP